MIRQFKFRPIGTGMFAADARVVGARVDQRGLNVEVLALRVDELEVAVATPVERVLRFLQGFFHAGKHRGAQRIRFGHGLTYGA